MNLFRDDAIRAEHNYRIEQAKRSWPCRPHEAQAGTARRISDAIRRWMRRRRNNGWAEQSIGQIRPNHKEMYPMTVTTKMAHEDEALIRGVVADIEHGFNSNDPERLARHIDDNALIVSPVGTVLRGPWAVEEAARELLIGGPLEAATAHYRLTEISRLAPDVAVAQKNAWDTPAEADDGVPPQMISLYVFVRRDDRWLVSRRQNTQVG